VGAGATGGPSPALSRRALLRGLTGAGVAALGVPLLGLGKRAGADPPAPPSRLRYVLVPHPDDEFDAWSLLADETDHYKVLILLTRGEHSGFADGHAIKTGHRMIVPDPRPSPGCTPSVKKAARLGAWHGFLDDMGLIDWTLGTCPRSLQIPDPVSGGPYTFDLRIGPRSARAAFDLGDGTLSPARVIGALRAVRAVRSEFPTQVEDDVVGAAYNNVAFPDAVLYHHSDHVAVQDALRSSKGGLTGPAYVRTVPSDPAVALTETMPERIYQAAMAMSAIPADPLLNPDADAYGAFQRHYGWLAFDMRSKSETAYWPTGDTAAVTPFCRTQTFSID